ncbi:MAG: hypothetical protein DRJ98_08285 [Thermoprotei archaeon]|nr:MAG: hypothetical protein DRJ98_08285 [Thermoprotei archaeon]
MSGKWAMRLEGTWDRGIPYGELRTRLLTLIQIARRQAQLGYKRARKRLANLYVLFIQLENAARVSEAYDAYLAYLETGQRKVWVRVRKHRRGQRQRLIIIPPDIPKPDKCPRPASLAAVEVFAQSIGLNTHTLRYARITDLAKRKVHPALLGKMTKHVNIKWLINYIQEREAEELLEQLVMGDAEEPRD